jgi:hypothetical protein
LSHARIPRSRCSGRKSPGCRSERPSRLQTLCPSSEKILPVRLRLKRQPTRLAVTRHPEGAPRARERLPPRGPLREAECRLEAPLKVLRTGAYLPAIALPVLAYSLGEDPAEGGEAS